jgi:hypothetical protein
MRYLKMLSLAVVVGAFLAFVGAGTATAEWQLCTQNAVCPTGHITEAGNMWEEGDIIMFHATNVTTTTSSGGNITLCDFDSRT